MLMTHTHAQAYTQTYRHIDQTLKLWFLDSGVLITCKSIKISILKIWPQNNTFSGITWARESKNVCLNCFFKILHFLLYLTRVREVKVLFWGQIFEMDILMDLHVMRTPESKNHIFSFWSVCTCRVCYQHSSKTN